MENIESIKKSPNKILVGSKVRIRESFHNYEVLAFYTDKVWVIDSYGIFCTLDFKNLVLVED